MHRDIFEYINNYLIEEDSLMFQQGWNKETSSKLDQLYKFSSEISKKEIITLEEMNIIKEYAITKGGFLTSGIRKIFYQKFYGINDNNKSTMIYINEDEHKFTKEPFKIYVFDNKEKNKEEIYSAKDKKIIKLDTERSKISSALNYSYQNKKKREMHFKSNVDLNKSANLNVSINSMTTKESENETPEEKREKIELVEMSDKIKSKLEEFIKIMSSLNQNMYDYYQGYHDIGLYFMLLYLKSPTKKITNSFPIGPNALNYDFSKLQSTNLYDTAIATFQRFTEFNLKENLQSNDTNKNNTYNFINCLQVLKYIITLISPETQKNIDLLSGGDGSATFAIPWLMSCFTHVVMSTHTVYRLLDFFIVNHPIAVYHVAAWIIIEELSQCNINEIESEGDIFCLFKDLDMDSLDYDQLIIKSDASMKTFPIDNNMKQLFKELGMKDYFPLINNESFPIKWTKTLHQTDLGDSFIWYIKGSYNLIKSIFDKTDSKNNKSTKTKKK